MYVKNQLLAYKERLGEKKRRMNESGRCHLHRSAFLRGVTIGIDSNITHH